MIQPGASARLLCRYSCGDACDATSNAAVSRRPWSASRTDGSSSMMATMDREFFMNSRRLSIDTPDTAARAIRVTTALPRIITLRRPDNSPRRQIRGSVRLGQRRGSSSYEPSGHFLQCDARRSYPALQSGDPRAFVRGLMHANSDHIHLLNRGHFFQAENIACARKSITWRMSSSESDRVRFTCPRTFSLNVLARRPLQ